ncbi:MAG: SUF system NifU family Fe-S cluster assembly protein, partial [Chloroflexi bacterium]|nr:SUF system NifU family Fe-S cluster assembly protein [Chloroflexota bacterium]
MDTRELYQQVILDHNRSPKNFKKIEKPTSMAVGHNPLCGDEITVSIVVDDGVVEDVGFQGVGCAISQASASMMTAAIKGNPVDVVRELFEKFHRMVASEAETDLDAMGKLA